MFKTWILNRLREPSTWAGIVTFVTGALGWTLSDEARGYVVTIGTSLVGLLLAISRDGHATPTDPPLIPPVLPPVPPPPGTGRTDHPTGDHDRGLSHDPASGVHANDRGRFEPRGVKDKFLRRGGKTGR